MISSSIDSSMARRALESLHDAMIGQGMDASNIIRDETRLLAKMIAAFTPPPQASGNARRAGEHAVEADLKNLISETSQSMIDQIGSAHGVHNIQAEYTRKDGTVGAIEWENLDPSGDRLAEYHEKYKNSKGRIPAVRQPNGVWKARVVVPNGVRDPYIKKVQRRVGRAKAAWAVTASKLGESFPSWISRHFSTLGSEAESNTQGLSNTMKPSVVFGSRVPGVADMRDKIQAALRARSKIIARKVKLILSGYNRDLANRMRAKARAKDFRENGPQVQ